MFEPKRKWFNEIDWEDRTVLLKGILSIKEEDYGRFTELALDAGMGEALAEESGEWAFSEEDGPRCLRCLRPRHRGRFGPRVHGELGRGECRGPAHLALHVRWREDARPRWSLHLRLGGKRGIREGAPLPMEGCVCDMCRFLLYYIDSIVGCYN